MNLGWRVPGLGQITWQIVLTKKMRGHEGENLTKRQEKSRISYRVSCGGSRGTRTVDAECKCAPSWNQI